MTDVILKTLLSGPLLDAINSRKVSPAFAQQHQTLATVLVTLDGLLDVGQLLRLVRLGSLLANKLPQGLLVVHAGSAEAVNTIAQVVVSWLVGALLLLGGCSSSLALCWYRLGTLFSHLRTNQQL